MHFEDGHGRVDRVRSVAPANAIYPGVASSTVSSDGQEPSKHRPRPPLIARRSGHLRPQPCGLLSAPTAGLLTTRIGCPSDGRPVVGKGRPNDADSVASTRAALSVELGSMRSSSVLSTLVRLICGLLTKPYLTWWDLVSFGAVSHALLLSISTFVVGVKQMWRHPGRTIRMECLALTGG